MNAGNYNFARDSVLEVNRHLDNLGIVLSIEDNERMYSPYANDFVVKVIYKNTEYRFLSHIKKQLAGNMARSLIEKLRADQCKCYLIIADYISPEIQKHLIKNDISFIDRSGKIFVSQNPLLLYIDYPRKYKQPAKHGSAFEVSGLKLVFHLLNKPDDVNKTYKHLAKEVDIATGSISSIISDLKKEGFVYNRQDKRFLRNKKELLEQWWVAYGRKLRSRLLVGRYRVIENALDKELPKGSWWSGEVAAELMGLNLRNQNQIIYTIMPPVDIVRTLRLIPDDKGQLELLTTFWSSESMTLYHEKTVSEILVYADLMLSRNDRNIEVANELLTQRIFCNR